MSDIRDFCPLWNEWVVESKLGEGSFGAVWKMRREILGGRSYYAAVKHMSIPKDESEVRRLLEEGVFTSEASAARYYDGMVQSLLGEIDTMHMLQGYTNIVSYEDHLIIPKQTGIGYDVFLRMELLMPLAERIRQKMTTADVVRLGKDIATAIDVLSAHHLIHRDIKPQNIFVNNTGDYKLGDYGTARVLENQATAMSRKGTYNYMAPEIYSNRPADIRADIYSLGIVLYRLLNGNRLPFLPSEGDLTHEMSDQAMLRRISGEPIPPPGYADSILSGIVLKACAFRQEDRYQNAGELKQELERYENVVNNDREIKTDPRRTKRTDDSYRYQFSSVSSNRLSEQFSNGSGSSPVSNTHDEEWADVNVQFTEENPGSVGENAGRTISRSANQNSVECSECNSERSDRRSLTGSDHPAEKTLRGRKQNKGWLVLLLVVIAVAIMGGILILTSTKPSDTAPVSTEPPTATAVLTEAPASTPIPTELPVTTAISTEEPVSTPISTELPQSASTQQPLNITAHRHTDEGSGVSFLIPDNWQEDTEVRDGDTYFRASVKHVLTDGEVVFVYSSVDDWTNGRTVAGSRAEYDDLMNRISTISAAFNGAQVEETVFNGVTYFRYKPEEATWQYFRYHNAILHLFQFNAVDDELYAPYFEAIMSSVVYP